MRLATAQYDYQRNTVKLVFTRLVQLVSVTSVTSVTRLLDYFFNIWPFNNNENLPNIIKIAKVGSNFNVKTKLKLKIFAKWRNFAYLATLIATHTRLACDLEFILPF